MKIECPYCGSRIAADVDIGQEILCPKCGEKFVFSASSIKKEIDRKLLDPADPGGFFANFPPEDDNL